MVLCRKCYGGIKLPCPTCQAKGERNCPITFFLNKHTQDLALGHLHCGPPLYVPKTETI